MFSTLYQTWFTQHCALGLHDPDIYTAQENFSTVQLNIRQKSQFQAQLLMNDFLTKVTSWRYTCYCSTVPSLSITVCNVHSHSKIHSIFQTSSRTILLLSNYSTQIVAYIYRVLLQFWHLYISDKYYRRMRLETRQVFALITHQLHTIIARSSQQAHTTQGCT